MKKLILIKTAYCILFSGGLQAQSNSLQQLITSEFNTLKAVSAATTRLRLDSTPVMSSSSLRKEGIIVINIPQVQRLVANAGVPYEKAIVRLLIAHELAHQMQYREYLVPSYTLLNECQADIIAGFLLFLVNNQDFVKIRDQLKVKSADDPLIKPVFNRLSDITFALYASIFSIGDNYSRDNNHPRSIERRTALRDGNTYGYFRLFETVAKDPGVAEKYRLQGRAGIKLYKTLLNIYPDDDLLGWSLRHARKIIHAKLDNCRNIVVLNKWEWHPSSDHPFVAYTQKIRNIGNNTVTINYLNQLYGRLNTDPNNSLYWTNISTASKAITLHPGESGTITDSLKWSAFEPGLPVYVPLGDVNSLYSCSCLNDVFPVQLQVRDNAEVLVNKPTDEAVLDVFISERKTLMNLIAGIGIQENSKDDNTVSYDSKLQYPSAKKTTIHFNIPTKQYTLDVLFYHGADENYAKNALAAILNNLAKLRMTVIPDNHSHWVIKDRHGLNAGSVDNLLSNDKDRYKVSLSVYGY